MERANTSLSEDGHAHIRGSLETCRQVPAGVPCATHAFQLAGRLSFASQHVFKRLGRALLVPIFKQIRSKSAVIKPELQKALTWWMQTLSLGMSEARCTQAAGMSSAAQSQFCQVRPWEQTQEEPLQLLCDARLATPICHCLRARNDFCMQVYSSQDWRSAAGRRWLPHIH